MARRWAHPVQRTRHGWRVVKGSLAWHYLMRQRRFLLLLLVVLPLGGIAYIPVIGLTRAMVDQGIVEQTVPLSYYLWRIIGLAVLAGFFVFALSQTLSRVAYQLEYDLRTDLYHSIQTACSVSGVDEGYWGFFFVALTSQTPRGLQPLLAAQQQHSPDRSQSRTSTPGSRTCA